MKRFIALLLTICLAISPVGVLGEEGTTTDVLDNSAELAKVEEIGIPNEELVNRLKTNADTLYAEQRWKEAAVAYEDAAKKANFLANILAQCCEPFYNRTDRSVYPSNSWLDKLVDLENRANRLKKIRNTCYVYEGIAYSKSGDIEFGLAVLLKALDIVEVNQEDIWIPAVDEVLSIIETSKVIIIE